MANKRTFTRRRLLRGLGGVVVGLPALDVFRRNANAAVPPTRKIYSAWFVQQNGLVQGPHFGTGHTVPVASGTACRCVG